MPPSDTNQMSDPPPEPTAQEVAEANAREAPSNPLEARLVAAENWIAALEARFAPLLPLVPVVETVVAAAVPGAAPVIAGGAAAAEGVAGVVGDLITSLNQHFGAKLSAQINMPAPGDALAAVARTAA